MNEACVAILFADMWLHILAVTKSGTGTWDLGRGNSGILGRGTRGRATWGRGDVGLGDAGTWDSGTRDTRLGDVGTWDSGMWRHGMQELGDVGTQGRDKQTTPEFCAEFWRSRERYDGEFANS